jgi:acetyltransferase-like isoleucine patch superfamily enzyme
MNDSDFLSIKVPFLGANDLTANLIEWAVKEGEFVQAGSLICTIETTKTIYDVSAPIEGFVKIAPLKDSVVKFDQVIAMIAKSANLIPSFEISSEESSKYIFTAKALLEMKKHNININDLNFSKKIIKESDIKNYLKELLQNSSSIHKSFPAINSKPILIMGAGHGNLTISSYLEESDSNISVAYIDYSSSDIERVIDGKPVFGYRQLESLFLRGCREIILHTPYEYIEEMDVLIRKIGFNYCSFIHKSAVVSSSSKLGDSIVVGPNVVIDHGAVLENFVYIGPNCIIGGNTYIGKGSMLLNGASLAHDSILGEACMVSDGARIAGRVSVGRHTLIGLNSTVNMDVEIGDRVVIASGASAYTSIPNNALLKKNGSISTIGVEKNE